MAAAGPTVPSVGKMVAGNLVVSAGGSYDAPRGPTSVATADNAVPFMGELEVVKHMVSAAGTVAAGGSSSEPHGPHQMAPTSPTVPSVGEMAAGNCVE
ncbi:unnamed protein product [Lampetra fluviatilis]